MARLMKASYGELELVVAVFVVRHLVYGKHLEEGFRLDYWVVVYIIGFGKFGASYILDYLIGKNINKSVDQKVH